MVLIELHCVLLLSGQNSYLPELTVLRNSHQVCYLHVYSYNDSIRLEKNCENKHLVIYFKKSEDTKSYAFYVSINTRNYFQGYNPHFGIGLQIAEIHDWIDLIIWNTFSIINFCSSYF